MINFKVAVRHLSGAGPSPSGGLVLFSKHGSVGLVKLNRPESLNSLSSVLFDELLTCLKKCDLDTSIGAIVLTGSEKAFAGSIFILNMGLAGADIKEMSERTFSKNINENFLGNWSEIQKIRKPIIAAVNGFALGGGCELAMMCDMIFAGSRAKFGQPEIKLGTIPGGGGTQRLLHAVGKSLAMDMILTGRMITADEAKAAGFVSRIFPSETLVDESIKVAETISEYSKLTVSLAKEAINSAMEMPLSQGLLFERRLFQATFATTDQKEGMAAFLEKRTPKFSDQ
ncbi:putative enoyl-CoA hydratase [Mitosporidium daphniae]